MKLYKKIICGVAATLSVAALQSCSEEKATLSGANTVYIEMSPKDIEMAVGDTVVLSAVVSNEAGDIINTPITWSVDNSDVVELTEKITYKKVKNTSRAEGDETDEPGTDEPGTDEPGTDDPLDPEQPADPGYTIVEIHEPCIVGRIGSQGKLTNVRATLENGMYSLTTVSVVARDISKAVTPITTFKRAYSRTALDTIWFKVTPYTLITNDKADVKFEINITERVTDTDGEYKDFTVQSEPYFDEANERVGVVYTGPRIAGKAECKMWLESGGQASEEAVVPISIYPLIWPGFEVDGKRPNPGPPSPSNIKVTLMNTTMDVNDTYNVGVCLGIDAGSDVDVENVKAAERAGMMKWTIDGSAVVVEDTYWDETYSTSGYVSYLKVRSGQRTGLSVIKYYMPDTVLTCNLQVDDFDKTYPVNRIVVKQGDQELSETQGAAFKLGIPASLEISVEPEPSFSFHIPEVTVADPSILDVEARDDASGYTRNFTLKRVGSTTITITSLDKTVTIPVTVEDRVDYIQWDQANPDQMYKGTSATIIARPHWASGKPASGEIIWTSSDPSIVKIEAGSFGQATVTALEVGTVDIYAEYEGVKTSRYELTVLPPADVNASDYVGFLVLSDAGNGNMALIYGENGDVYAEVPFVTEGEYEGTFSGTEGHVELGQNVFDGCSYNFTVTAAGEDADGNIIYTVTGTITMPNGGRIVMNGETFILG